ALRPRISPAVAGIEHDDRASGRGGFGQLDLAHRRSEFDRDRPRPCFADEHLAGLVVDGGLAMAGGKGGRGQCDAGDDDRRARSRPCSLRPWCHESSYHANMVNTQLCVEISGSSTPVAVAALAWG